MEDLFRATPCLPVLCGWPVTGYLDANCQAVNDLSLTDELIPECRMFIDNCGNLRVLYYESTATFYSNGRKIEAICNL